MLDGEEFAPLAGEAAGRRTMVVHHGMDAAFEFDIAIRGAAWLSTSRADFW